MKNSSQSKPSVASAVLVLILAASGFNLAVTKGQDSKRPVTSLNGTNIWTAPLRAARKPNPVPADATAIDQGKTLFSMACVPCHGPSGRGDGPSSSALERNGEKIQPGNLSDPKMWSQSDGAIFWKITEGNSPMPTFGETFTEEQRWQIVNYVRTLAARPTPGTAGIAQH